ncbi:hypothetical protein [Leifsonia poae]|uniref:hypothetical protein n=1 Tax=Leifsonia poae TaxID=110933 RepID=UPI003D67296F
MHFMEISRADADRFRDFVAGRQAARLVDLAHWMAATDGPIESMDATVDSLVPLWEWFVQFVDAGCPGVPRDARWAVGEAIGVAPGSEESERAIFAGESIEHYVYLVCAKALPETNWRVYDWHPNKRVIHRNMTGIYLGPSRAFVPIQDIVPRLSASVVDGTPLTRARSRLREVVLLNGGEWLVEATRDELRGPSVLAPLLTKPTVPCGADVRRPPAFNSQTFEVNEPDGEVGGEYILARGSADELDDPRRLRPLPVDRVAAALAELRFEAESGPLEDALRQDDATVLSELGAAVTTSVVSGELRALLLEPAGADSSRWAQIVEGFTQLARALGAALHTDES